MELRLISIRPTDGVNVVIGQAHFIRTPEDLAEAVATSVPQARFGLAFNEASGPCLVRAEGNDAELQGAAVAHALAIGAGHVFVLLLRDAYPINVLPQIKACVEVCTIFCATANAVEVIVAESELGRGVLGVIDGAAAKAAETPEDLVARRAFLRAIGYKL
jgi:uncharacterized protein